MILEFQHVRRVYRLQIPPIWSCGHNCDVSAHTHCVHGVNRQSLASIHFLNGSSVIKIGEQVAYESMTRQQRSYGPTHTTLFFSRSPTRQQNTVWRKCSSLSWEALEEPSVLSPLQKQVAENCFCTLKYIISTSLLRHFNNTVIFITV